MQRHDLLFVKGKKGASATKHCLIAVAVNSVHLVPGGRDRQLLANTVLESDKEKWCQSSPIVFWSPWVSLLGCSWCFFLRGPQQNQEQSSWDCFFHSIIYKPSLSTCYVLDNLLQAPPSLPLIHWGSNNHRRLNYDWEASENQLSPSCQQTNKNVLQSVFWRLNIKLEPSSTGRFSQSFSGAAYFSTLLISEGHFKGLKSLEVKEPLRGGWSVVGKGVSVPHQFHQLCLLIKLFLCPLLFSFRRIGKTVNGEDGTIFREASKRRARDQI